jgi:hypothetical protein
MVEDAREVISRSDISCPLRDSDIQDFGTLGKYWWYISEEKLPE